MPRRRRPAIFSATKAVKANAREHLGTPPPERILPDTRDRLHAQAKHKETLAETLGKAARGDDE